MRDNRGMSKKIKPRIVGCSSTFPDECSFDELYRFLMDQGFEREDFDKVKVEIDYSSCYYEGDSPNLCVSYPDIF